MMQSRLIAVAALAGSLLLPALAQAGTPPSQSQDNGGHGMFTGAGNLWSGRTRSAGAPPGATPGSKAGEAAHQRGLAAEKNETAAQQGASGQRPGG